MDGSGITAVNESPTDKLSMLTRPSVVAWRNAIVVTAKLASVELAVVNGSDSEVGLIQSFMTGAFTAVWSSLKTAVYQVPVDKGEEIVPLLGDEPV